VIILARVRRLLMLLLLLPALVLAACGEDDPPASAGSGGAEVTTPAETAPAESTESEAADPAEGEAGQGGCRAVEPPEPKGEPSLDRPTRRLKASATYDVVMRTSCGSFTIRLDQKENPKTAASFAALVRGKFFDGLTFHRVVPEFVIQGGDPAGDGSGGPGYSVEEAPPADQAYTKGVVAMAKTGAEPPGTSGSQFFVVTGADVGLPPEYAVAGEVTEGMEAVDAIAALGTTDGPPSQPVVIQSARLKTS
jgi:cyclophilin family peptidyl-prolyl cis-trans isomerase